MLISNKNKTVENKLSSSSLTCTSYLNWKRRKIESTYEPIFCDSQFSATFVNNLKNSEKQVNIRVTGIDTGWKRDTKGKRGPTKLHATTSSWRETPSPPDETGGSEIGVSIFWPSQRATENGWRDCRAYNIVCRDWVKKWKKHVPECKTQSQTPIRVSVRPSVWVSSIGYSQVREQERGAAYLFIPSECLSGNCCFPTIHFTPSSVLGAAGS